MERRWIFISLMVCAFSPCERKTARTVTLGITKERTLKQKTMSEQTSSQSEHTDDLVYQFAVGPSAWYAACGSGLYRSSDRGASWELAYTSLGAASPLTTLAVATVVGRAGAPLVFAGLSGGLLRSVDDGIFWELASQPSPAPIFTALIPVAGFRPRWPAVRRDDGRWRIDLLE